MLFRAVLLASLAAPPQISAAPATAQAHDPLQWSGLHYRQVGPWRGGRATTVTGGPPHSPISGDACGTAAGAAFDAASGVDIIRPIPAHRVNIWRDPGMGSCIDCAISTVSG